MSQSPWSQTYDNGIDDTEYRAARIAAQRAQEDLESLSSAINKIDDWTNSVLNASYGEWRQQRDEMPATKGATPYPDFFMLYNISNGRFINDLVIDACRKVILAGDDIEDTVDRLTSHFVMPDKMDHFDTTMDNTTLALEKLTAEYKRNNDFPSRTADHQYVYEFAHILFNHMDVVTIKTGYVTAMEEKLVDKIKTGLSESLSALQTGMPHELTLLPVEDDKVADHIANSFDTVDQWLKMQKLVATKNMNELQFDPKANDILSDTFNLLTANVYADAIYSDLLNFLHMHRENNRWPIFFEKAACDISETDDKYLTAKHAPKVTENMGIKTFFKTWFELYLDPEHPYAELNQDPENMQIVGLIVAAIDRDFPLPLEKAFAPARQQKQAKKTKSRALTQ